MSTCNDFITTTRSNGLLRLTLNRPAKKNAITGDMYRTMTQQLNQASADESIHVVLLGAEGNFFCAGNDINGFEKIRDIPYLQRPGFRFMNTLATFPKPVVAAVSGSAVGIGVTLLLHCDLVYAHRDSHLTMPFVDIGLVPEFASTLLLPAMVGHARAAELLMLGKPVSAHQAMEIGLVNAVCDSDVDAYAQQVCQQLLGKSPQALTATKRLMKQTLQTDIVNTIERETIALNRCLPTINLP